MKKILTILFTLILSTNVFALDVYMSQFGDDANDGLSWATAVLSLPQAVAIVQDAGNTDIRDTIHIGKGLYQIDMAYSNYYITITKAFITIKCYNNPIFIGKGKSISANNTFFWSNTNTGVSLDAGGTIDGVTILEFYDGFYTSNAYALNIYNSTFLNNNRVLYGSRYNRLYYNIAINNNLVYALVGATPQFQIYNNTFYKNTEVLQDYGGSNNFPNLKSNNFVDNGRNFTTNPSLINCLNNNFYMTGAGSWTFSTGSADNLSLDPHFNDTTVASNPILSLKRNSPIAFKSFTNSYIGALGVADYSTRNQTSTFDNWYSWLNDNDSVQVKNDTAFAITTDSGLVLKYENGMPMERRVTALYTNLGINANGKLIRFGIDATEVFNVSPFQNMYAVIDYDTSTPVRKYRYISSTEPITPSMMTKAYFDSNATVWNLGDYLPFTDSLYFAVELYYRYNFAFTE